MMLTAQQPVDSMLEKLAGVWEGRRSPKLGVLDRQKQLYNTEARMDQHAAVKQVMPLIPPESKRTNGGIQLGSCRAGCDLQLNLHTRLLQANSLCCPH